MMTTVAPHQESGGLRTSWHELMQHRRRRLLAQGYEAVLRELRDPAARWMSARVPVQVEQVRAAEPDIERLIGRLRGGRPISGEAMSLARKLLVEPGSPVFEWAEPRTLRRRVRGILDAMG